MDWPQRDRFVFEVEKYQQKTKRTHALVAKDLGIGLATLRNFLYGSKRPGLATAQRAAALFECSITDFLDDPGAQIPGIPDGVDEEHRAWMSAMYHATKDVPADERDRMLKMIQVGWTIGAARKPKGKP